MKIEDYEGRSLIFLGRLHNVGPMYVMECLLLACIAWRFLSSFKGARKAGKPR